MKPQTPQHFPLVDKESFTIDNDASKTNILNNDLMHLPDVVIQTDTDFKITGWNESADKICALTGSKGKSIFDLDNINFTETCPVTLKEQFSKNGVWSGNIHFKGFDGTDIHFRSVAHYILNEAAEPFAVIITNHNITQQVLAEQKLAETEAIYKMLINTLDEGVLLIETTGAIMASNRRATEILSITEEQLLGKMPVGAGGWKVFKADGRPFPNSELPVVVSLLTGFPQKKVEMRLENPSGNSIWLSVSSQALVREGEFNPYAVVVSFTDISKAKTSSVF